MSNISKILVGAAGLAAVVGAASPAMAQGYPYGTPYGTPNNGGVLGAIINSVTGGGYGQYPQGNYGYGQVNERVAVSQCAAAAEQRLNGGYRQQGYGNGYQNNGYQYGYGNNGYQNGYQNGYGQARVVGITNVERRGNGNLRVTGLATSGAAYGAYGNQGYDNRYQGNGYGNQGYGNQGYANQAADLRFTCKVNLRGQVTDVKINRRTAYGRGY